MNAELPPFKDGEHNSKSASTNARDITPLNTMFCRRHAHIVVFSPAKAASAGEEGEITSS